MNPAALADALAAAIAAGDPPRGALLPGERRLVERFGVSRPLLREAIRLLAARGLVETRHGQGTRVVADHARPVRGAFAGALGADARRDDHLLELRLAVECAIAATAARRRTTADVAALEELIAGFAATADVDRAAALDVAFHARLAAAARNPLFVVVLAPLAGLLEQDRPAGLRRMTSATALADHRAILAAVRRRQPAAAERAMRRHLARLGP